MKTIQLLISIICFLINISASANTSQTLPIDIQKKLEALETKFDGKIGVYAINTNNNQIIAYRADQTFPVQSTSKLISVAALLNQSSKDKNLLQEKIHYTKNDLVFWYPITGEHVLTGMTLQSLSEATITYSDDTAMNLITKKLGGPQKVTHFAHAIGNSSFNMEHYEGHLNSNPNKTDDTSTPKDMALSVEKLALGNVLTESQRAELIQWMRNDTVAYKRIRAGVPAAWVVADKTGAGDYGVNNDIGVLWSPVCKPVVLAIYTVRNKKDEKPRDDIIASTTDIIMRAFAKNDSCFTQLPLW